MQIDHWLEYTFPTRVREPGSILKYRGQTQVGGGRLVSDWGQLAQAQVGARWRTALCRPRLPLLLLLLLLPLLLPAARHPPAAPLLAPEHS